MENFIYGLQSSGETIRLTFLALAHHPIMWGFGVGFVASTFIHLFIITDIPHAIPLMVTKGAAESFQKIAPRNKEGAYELSYTAFQKEHARVRIAFYLAVTAFFAVTSLALLKG